MDAPLDPASFPHPGLYLLFPDGDRVDLVRETIEATANSFLEDPARIPESVKRATDYQPCDICPHRETATICHSIMPTLPFVDLMDRYPSFTPVTAVYRDQDGTGIESARTNLAQALKYVTILSLMFYCEVGQKYAAYWQGINPLMDPEEIAAALHRNMVRELAGDADALRERVETMREELMVTTRCQMNRLKLISRKDAFLNAFAHTHDATQWLMLEVRKHLQD